MTSENSTTPTFEQIFESIDSLSFSLDKIVSPIHWTIDRKNNIYICDYNGAFFIRVRKNDNKVEYVAKSELGIKNPISATIDLHGNLYISDNSSRRIVILDTNLQKKSSFVLAGTHITPTAMYAKDDKLYVGGYSMRDGKNIHVYSTTGEKLSSFYSSKFTDKYLSDHGGGLNYVLFTIDCGEFFVTENLSYSLSSLDSLGDVLYAREIDAPDFVKSSKYDAQKLIDNYPTLSSKFSRPRAIHILGERIFVQVQMPERQGIKSDDNFFENFDNWVDVYNRKGESIYSRVNTGTRQLIGIDHERKSVCFLTIFDRKSKTAAIKWYKLREI